MRNSIFSPILFLLFFLFSLAPALGEEESLARLQEVNRLLRAELDLARDKKLYFVFDLGEQPRIEFKGSGVTVTELRVQTASLWGHPPELKVRTVAGKDTLFPPKRQTIVFSGVEKPVEEKEPAPPAEEKPSGAPPELQALELKDMPTFFHARLDDGMLLTVHPAPEDLSSRILEFFRAFYWYLSRPLISGWHFVHGKPYTEVRLVLPADEVRLLYWSFTEGASCLIARP